ncbi:hypothetical protein [Amycolatopsis palatopharyngis]|uniref:hypothetical protein n=1 Tax=Amycolatopsis palatopharyngis TaxID=187982 RepID=UPI0013BE91D4|nr:hypothetical protein [Amycolatopsis palatopharyngis]
MSPSWPSSRYSAKPGMFASSESTTVAVRANPIALWMSVGTLVSPLTTPSGRPRCSIASETAGLSSAGLPYVSLRQELSS